jgi:hypothetical protein
LCIKINVLHLSKQTNKQMKKVIKITGTFANSLTKRENNSTYVMVNELGQYGYLPNENTPYMPVGGKKTLLSVESILIFK